MDRTVSTHVHLTAPARAQTAPTVPVSTIIAWGVKTPGNIGAILRLAANFGCGRVLLVEEPGVEHNLRRILRTAVAAPSYVEWSFVTPEAFVNEWAPRWPIVGLETSVCSVDLQEAQWPADCALMVGAESNGLPDRAVALCEQVVHIPTCGPLHSLNVSHALAIALYGSASRR